MPIVEGGWVGVSGLSYQKMPRTSSLSFSLPMEGKLKEKTKFYYYLCASQSACSCENIYCWLLLLEMALCQSYA